MVRSYRSLVLTDQSNVAFVNDAAVTQLSSYNPFTTCRSEPYRAFECRDCEWVTTIVTLCSRFALKVAEIPSAEHTQVLMTYFRELHANSLSVMRFKQMMR
jgi:hypothetical protein